MTESDGIEEAFEGILRTAVMAGSQIAAQLARRHELHLQQQQLRDQHEAKLLSERLDAEKHTALASLAQVYRGEWWDHADPQSIGQTLATAVAWSSEDPAAAQAEQRMRDEIQARYSIDADTLLAQVRGEHQASDPNRQHRAEETEAEALVAVAAAEVAQEPLYDSAERRAADATRLKADGVEPAVVEARLQADAGVGVPASQATSSTGRGGAAPRARTNRGRGAQLTRPGVER